MNKQKKREIEIEIDQKIVFEKTFKHSGGDETFSAYHDAVIWLTKFGIDSGRMERDNPIGLAKNSDISKWSRLLGYDGGNTFNDRRELDGAMVSESFRDSDVTVFLVFDPTKEKS